MKLWIFSTCCYLLAAQGTMIPQEKLTPQEAFFLRRVTEFWKDRDYVLVKKQIDEFLASHETSNIHNNLYALLGDTLYQESNYASALEYYNRISDPLLIEKVISRRLQCLYLSEKYDEVIEVLTPLLNSAEKKVDYAEEMQFILGDSLFRKMRQTSDKSLQQQLAMRAKPLLHGLFQTNYKDKVLLPLAETHRELREFEEASPLYVMLAEKCPSQQEEFLLQAAILQQEFDPLQALTTFQTVVDIGGKRASEAAYQELLLLFQHDRFSSLISRASKLEMNLDADKKALLEFCLARSYFKLDQLPEAIQHFKVFINQEPENTPHKRAAFLTLIHCAQKTDDNQLFDQTLEQFLTGYPQDEEAGKALLLHAQTALRRGEITQASYDLDRLMKSFPDFPDQETLLYDQALLLSRTEQWSASRSAFLSYLGRFPSTPHSNLIWSSIVHCSIQELKKASDDQLFEKKEQLASDLAQALALSSLFSPEEEASYQFLLGQLMFELYHFSEAIQELSYFCQKYSDHPSIPEAYLLQALSHRELKSNSELFIPVAEKALALSDDPAHQTTLRLQLFNTYLSLKEYDKAAENLYQTFIVDGNSIQQENQLWLTRYYAKRAESGDADSQGRMMELFKKVLRVDDTYAVHFDPSQTYLEAETLKFAGILGLSEREQVLRSLIKLQQTHDSLPWKLQGRALFELAKTCRALQKNDEALERFTELITKEGAISSTVRSAALLERSRLLLLGYQEGKLNEEDPNLRAILSTLKDLQIQKELLEEPVHLEAALEYADLRTALAPEHSRIESALFFLNRIKEDFNGKTDPICVEYHESRLRFPEKDQLFQTYMKCLEAEILHWEAMEAIQNNNLEKAARHKQDAVALFEEILKDDHATGYVKQRAEAKLNQIRL